MNAEIIKTMTKERKKESALSQWWSKNGYKVWRIILFPVWLYTLIKECVDKHLYEKTVWDEAKAKEILDYYIPRRFQWIDKDKCFYLYDDISWSSTKKLIKRKDRRFWEKFSGFYGGTILKYLVDTYQIEGFTKKVAEPYEYAMEIWFYLN